MTLTSLTTIQFVFSLVLTTLPSNTGQKPGEFDPTCCWLCSVTGVTSSVVPIPAFHTCVLSSNRRTELAYLAISLTYDTVTFSITLLYTLRSTVDFRVSTVLKAILRDGTIYFLVIFSSNLVWLLSIIYFRVSYFVLVDCEDESPDFSCLFSRAWSLSMPSKWFRLHTGKPYWPTPHSRGNILYERSSRLVHDRVLTFNYLYRLMPIMVSRLLLSLKRAVRPTQRVGHDGSWESDDFASRDERRRTLRWASSRQEAESYQFSTIISHLS